MRGPYWGWTTCIGVALRILEQSETDHNENERPKLEGAVFGVRRPAVALLSFALRTSARNKAAAGRRTPKGDLLRASFTPYSISYAGAVRSRFITCLHG